MAGYQKPGILVTEVDTPNTTTVLDRPTLIGVVGLALGHETFSVIKFLRDNDEVALEGANVTTSPASSFVVRDINTLNKVYQQGSDYTLSTDSDGVTYIKRNLYTTMVSQESTVVVMDTDNGIQTANVVFDYENTTSTITPPNGGTISIVDGVTSPGPADISLQKAGQYRLVTDYEINLANGRIRRADTSFDPASSGCHIMSGQTVYVTYTTGNGANTYTDELVTLTGQTYAQLAGEGDDGGVDTESIVVCNRPDVSTNATTVVIFTAGVNGTSGVDFEFTFDDPSVPTSFTMKRNVIEPTTMGIDTNSINVRIDYKYIPEDYYVPTLFTSFHELETKYGAAFDSDGNVVSPLSASAYMAFRSGSNEVVAQALYTLDSNNMRVQGTESDPLHWAETLTSLESQSSINVLVPAVGQGSFPTMDDVTANETVAAIQLKFVDLINTMAQDNQYVIAIFGEDSTKNGKMVTSSSVRGSNDVLRTHAQILGQQSYPERTVLVSPSVFTMSNPATGKLTYVGGQYVAASLAGVLARDAVQSSLTRKSVPGVIDVGDYRNESEKNADAATGLTVVETKNGVARVRHAITTAVNDATKRELNAMRSKFFMIESVKRTLDENVVGRVLTDSRAEFIVSTTVAGVLEYMQNTGAIVNYSAVGATRSTASPTSMTVRFSYSLPYPINNIEIALSLDTITGTVNAQ